MPGIGPPSGETKGRKDDQEKPTKYWREALPRVIRRWWIWPIVLLGLVAVFVALEGLFEEGPPAFVEPELVRIPAGPFLMGSSDSDKYAYDDEKPQHKVELAEYYIGKYPVTNAEYQVFVGEAGREAPVHWRTYWFFEDLAGYPVTNVSWHDAIAYCEWLSQKTGRDYRIPSEAEWEKAARGTEGLIYPWGNEWDSERCNSWESGPGGTTPVGDYSPKGDSPYGVADMAGNVWEWTRGLWGEDVEEPEFKYPYDPTNGGREDLKAPDSVCRVLRGGSFYNTALTVRGADRHGGRPGGRGDFAGFRVVVSPLL
jgi:formylglycine-generating enzyme required for sulfatase activity